MAGWRIEISMIYIGSGKQKHCR